MTHSSGNHGAALALAAQLRGIRAWVVMPRNAPKTKRAAVEGYGAEITLCEPTLAAREAAAAELLRSTGAVLIHPYNDDSVIAGQGTAALELLEEIPDLDVICAPVSGGGLLSGTAIAAKALRPEIAVIGCEPANADDAARVARLPKDRTRRDIDLTIADGLRATLAPRTFAILRELADRIVLLAGGKRNRRDHAPDRGNTSNAQWSLPVRSRHPPPFTGNSASIISESVLFFRAETRMAGTRYHFKATRLSRQHVAMSIPSSSDAHCGVQCRFCAKNLSWLLF